MHVLGILFDLNFLLYNIIVRLLPQKNNQSQGQITLGVKSSVALTQGSQQTQINYLFYINGDQLFSQKSVFNNLVSNCNISNVLLIWDIL